MDTIIKINTINAPVKEYKDARLTEARNAILTIYSNAAAYVDNGNREIAKILGKVLTDKSYQADGFKSVAEFAADAFGMKSSNAYQYANAGRIYNDAPDSKAAQLSPAKYAEVAKVDPETLEAALTNGEIGTDSTLSELRDWTKTKVQTKPKAKVLDNYRFKCLGGESKVIKAIGAIGDATIEDGVKAIELVMQTETADIVKTYKLDTLKGDKTTILYTVVNLSTLEVAAYSATKVKAQKVKKTGKTKTVTELDLAQALGISIDEVRAIIARRGSLKAGE